MILLGTLGASVILFALALYIVTDPYSDEFNHHKDIKRRLTILEGRCGR